MKKYKRKTCKRWEVDKVAAVIFIIKRKYAMSRDYNTMQRIEQKNRQIVKQNIKKIEHKQNSL